MITKLPDTKPLAGIDIPTPAELQIAHDEGQRPDPALLKAALLCIVKVLTDGWPAKLEHFFAYTEDAHPADQPATFLGYNMVGPLKAALIAKGWNVIQVDGGITVKAKRMRTEGSRGRAKYAVRLPPSPRNNKTDGGGS